MKKRNVAVLVLGTADWNQPIATNQHYVVQELCKGDLDVTFTESLALRRPTLSSRDLRRILSRLKSVVAGKEDAKRGWRPTPADLRVISPLVIPAHRGPAATANRYLLHRTVREWLSQDGPRILWTYTPKTYGLEEKADAVVYHCVDLLGTVPGIDERVVEAGERRLAKVGATAIASSRIVAEHLREMGFPSPRLWENVADTKVFSAAARSKAPRHAGRVVFAGNLTPTKVDYVLLKSLAERGLDVRVAGPRAEGGGKDESDFADLVASGVKYCGMLTPVELAELLASAAVGVIPYQINDYTRGVSPLKTYEYMAAGLSVVSSELPGVHPDDVDIFTESSAIEFIDRVIAQSVKVSTSEVERRIAAAFEHSWDRRGENVRELIDMICVEEDAHTHGNTDH